jgi:hypothetical protein
MPSAIRPVPHRESLPIPEPPNYFSLNCDDGDARRNTAAIYYKKSGIFLNITSAEPHKIMQK